MTWRRSGRPGTRDAATGAVPLAGQITGTGPLVVLLHELAENRHAWDPVLPRLAARFRVLAVDLRGHGDSPAGDGWSLDDQVADLHASVTGLTGRDAAGRDGPGADAGAAPVVVGHGYGAFVAAGYATWHPTVAVLDLDQHLSGAWTAPLVATLPAEPTAEQVEAVLVHPAGYGPLPSSEQDRLRALRRVDPDVLHAAWAPLRRDPRSRQAWAEESLAFLPGVRLVNVLATDPGKRYAGWLREHTRGDVRVEGWADGHYPHLVEPDRFVDLVARLAQPGD